jgi:hypothetical protein
MGRKKKVKPIDVMLELGKRKNGEPDYLEFVEKHFKKFNTIDKAQALLWCVNITTIDKAPKLYEKMYNHFLTYNFKNDLTVKRLESLEAFLWDYNGKGED